MPKQPVSPLSKESMWRDCFKRQASSGKSIAGFCKDESIPVWAFYSWRSKLKPAPIEQISVPAPADFIDLGEVGSLGNMKSTPPSTFELRISLGDGLSLTISKI